jgi:hypothetical protein
VTSPGDGFPRDALVMTFSGALASKVIDPFTVNSALTKRCDVPTITVLQDGDPGTTVAFETVTPNSGPSVWDVEENWSLGHVPVAGEDLEFWGTTVNVCWELPQDNTRFGTISIWRSASGDIGLPDINTTGFKPYDELRDKTLRISADTWKIGTGEGRGSQLMRIDIGDSPDVHVEGTSYPRSNIRALMLSGGSDETVVNIDGGSVALGGNPDETFTALAVYSMVELYVGDAVTVETIEISGGNAYLYSGYTSLILWKGTVYQMDGSPGTTTLLAHTQFYYNTSSNGGDFTVPSNAKLDFSRGTERVTINSLTGGGAKIDPTNRCTVLG